MRKVLIIISTEDGESIYNAMRLANLGVKKGDEISVFMLGKGVVFEKSGSKNFDVMGQINMFVGDFYCLKGMRKIPQSGGIKRLPNRMDG
jgi:uncharacterized protein involved in oxidation of intracellular sulfur